MARLSNILRSLEGGQVTFWCPGCNCPHAVKVEGYKAWAWDGDVDKPTFSPSVLIQGGHFLPWTPDGNHSCWCTYYKDRPLVEKLFKCRQCHSFIRDGQIHFLHDCSHELAGKVVPIPNWPTSEE